MQDIDDDRPTAPLDKSEEPLWKRLIFMLIIAAMISVAQSILFLIAVIQFIIILIDQRQPNERLADFGCMVGAWVAKAARYMSIATDAKPWPFKDMD
jgi:succinate-acetate transporter protein